MQCIANTICRGKIKDQAFLHQERPTAQRDVNSFASKRGLEHSVVDSANMFAITGVLLLFSVHILQGAVQLAPRGHVREKQSLPSEQPRQSFSMSSDIITDQKLHGGHHDNKRRLGTRLITEYFPAARFYVPVAPSNDEDEHFHYLFKMHLGRLPGTRQTLKMIIDTGSADIMVQFYFVQ